MIVTSACLTDAIRSQGFSPSQRLDPTDASWLCFKPLPPIGFCGLQSFSRWASRCTSRRTVLSCRWAASRAARAEAQDGKPPFRLIAPKQRPATVRTSTKDSRPRLQSLAPTKRPTLDARLFTRDRAAALLAFSPSEASHSIVGPKPSPHTLQPVIGMPVETDLTHMPACASGSRSDQAWRPLRGVIAAPLGFATSYKPHENRAVACCHVSS